MKLRIILAVSICLNVVLAAVHFSVRSGGGGSAAVEPEPMAAEAEPVAIPGTEAGKGSSERLEAKQLAERLKALDWRKVESADYRQYIENLRGIGCPEETIQDIIVADVEKLFRERRKEEGGGTNRFEYWKVGNPLAAFLNEETVARNQERAQEKRALLKELLGMDVNRPELAAAFNPYEDLLEFLPGEKMTALTELDQKYAAKTMKTLKAVQQGDTAALREVLQEKDAELLDLLGPEGKLEYDLRLSQTAVLMRMKLTDFQPTEQEYRAMFELQHAFDTEQGSYGIPPSGREEKAAYDAGKRELDEALEAVLGEDRYREYQNDQEWGQSSLSRVAKEFGIPKEQALPVLDVRRAAQESAEQIRNDASLGPEQKAAAQEQIQQATIERIGELIGADAAKAYVEGGSSIKNLVK